MTNHVPVALALLLVGCGSVQTTPSSKTLQRSGEVTLDLSRSRTIEFKGWRIAVLDANDSIIRYEVVGSPAP